MRSTTSMARRVLITRLLDLGVEEEDEVCTCLCYGEEGAWKEHVKRAV